MRTRKHYFEVLEKLANAICVCNANGEIMMYNKALVEQWGWRPTIGRMLSDDEWKILRRDGSEFDLTGYITRRAVKAVLSVDQVDVLLVGRDGCSRNAVLHSSMLYDVYGNFNGSINMLTDDFDHEDRKSLHDFASLS